ncbi:MAG: glycosyltransferase [bacterium]|nr:glycosyltransferase [bacterium]
MAKVVVVVTVLNEVETVDELIRALKSQTVRPTEIIIVDGGSTDGTLEKLRKYSGLKILSQPGNRSVGRNFGVNKTRSPLIAFTDAGCIPNKDWLKELIKPFAQKEVQVVSGYYKGLPKNAFEKCLVPYVLVMPDKIPGEFWPASRSMALTSSVWIASGGFNPNLWHNEDYEFAHRLKKLGYNFIFAPEAVVGWQPRQNLSQAAWMFLRFAIGDMQARIWRPKVKLLMIRYYAFFFLVFITPWTWVLTIPYLVWAIWKNYKYVKDPRAFFWLPILQLTSDIMVLFGSIVGLLSTAAKV